MSLLKEAVKRKLLKEALALGALKSGIGAITKRIGSSASKLGSSASKLGSRGYNTLQMRTAEAVNPKGKYAKAFFDDVTSYAKMPNAPHTAFTNTISQGMADTSRWVKNRLK
jgi:hypothetical protein